ncbi:MAG: hypothetical protein RIC89_13960 [Pseudomonadales bacterium]
MTATEHLTDLTLSLLADGELDEAQTIQSQAHLQQCAACQSRLDATRAELTAFQTALSLGETAPDEIVIPDFKRPASLRGFALANIATGLVIWLAQFLWKTLFGELFVNAASWLTSIYVPDIYELITTTALYYLQEGTAMLEAYIGLTILTLVTVTVLGLLFTLRRHRAAGSLCVLVLVAASTLAPAPASALEIRKDQNVVTVSADESIDDTLIATAETVLIHGNISGDVIAAGRKVEVTGSIAGNLFAFGDSVVVRGDVGGLMVGSGSTVDVLGGKVGGNLFAAGNMVSVDTDSVVGGNVGVAGQRGSLAGVIQQDVYSFTEMLEVNGTLSRDLSAFGARVQLLDAAHILGDANLHIGAEDNLHRSAGARIDGKLEFMDTPEDFKPTNRYATVGFYMWQAARLIAALLFGLALLWLFPGFASVTLGGGLEGLKSAGIGFVSLIILPFAVALTAITLVGLPFAFVGLISWILLVYLAKIVVGIAVGQLVLSNSEGTASNVMVLLVGLAIIIVAVNLPIIGGIINFLLTVLGVGLIVQYVARPSGPLKRA